jgi:hypothetical protein
MPLKERLEMIVQRTVGFVHVILLAGKGPSWQASTHSARPLMRDVNGGKPAWGR